jgi:hypothetical protein
LKGKIIGNLNKKVFEKLHQIVFDVFSGGLHFFGLHVSHGVRVGSIPAHEKKNSKIHDGKDQVSLLTQDLEQQC